MFRNSNLTREKEIFFCKCGPVNPRVWKQMLSMRFRRHGWKCLYNTYCTLWCGGGILYMLWWRFKFQPGHDMVQLLQKPVWHCRVKCLIKHTESENRWGNSDVEAQMSGIKFWNGDENLRPVHKNGFYKYNILNLNPHKRFNKNNIAIIIIVRNHSWWRLTQRPPTIASSSPQEKA
jgi:hypothetical protein